MKTTTEMRKALLQIQIKQKYCQSSSVACLPRKTQARSRPYQIIRRNFDYLDKNIFMQLYRSLVRPHLEVSNSAWSPILKQDIETIEDVQKKSHQANTRFQGPGLSAKTETTGPRNPNLQETAGWYDRNVQDCERTLWPGGSPRSPQGELDNQRPQ